MHVEGRRERKENVSRREGVTAKSGERQTRGPSGRKVESEQGEGEARVVIAKGARRRRRKRWRRRSCGVWRVVVRDCQLVVCLTGLGRGQVRSLRRVGE